MGRPVCRDLEHELMIKFRKLFERVLETVNKENPLYTFCFEHFVDSFDENDHFTERIVEFLVKETAQRHRQANPTAQHPLRPRPHTIHHYLGEDGNMDGISNGAGDSNDSTNASTSATNANASTNTGTGTSTNAGGPALRRSYNFHTQRTYLPHHILPGFERESVVRAPSSIGGPHTSDSSPMSSSGAALRYLLSNQGFGLSGRRSRIQQRASSSDLFSFHQSQNQSQSQGQNQSQSQNQSQHSLISAMNVLTGSNPFTEGSTSQNRGSATSSMTQETDTTNNPNSSSLATTMRRSIRRDLLDRPSGYVFRSPSRAHDLSNSMEHAPDSFRVSSSSLMDSLDSAVDDLFGPRPSLSDRVMTDQARHLQDYIRHAQEFRHQQRRQHYIQALQRGRRRHPTMAAPHQRQTTLGIPSTDPQQSQQQQEPRYQSRDNGLMLVQPYPSSSSSITGSNTGSESTANGVLSQAVPSLSTLSSRLSHEDRYREFTESTRRSRSAMRNALVEDLLSEDTQQVLLAGEMSRRRRRRILGRISSLMGSPDMASHNSSTIISESQQDQQQGQMQNPEGGEPLVSSVAPSEEAATQTSVDPPQALAGSLDSTDANTSQPVSAPSSAANQETTTALPVPTFTVELADGDATHDGNNTSRSHTGGVGLGLNAEHGNHEDHDDHSHQSVPPTPPSPNPNRNPMPTFTDRRRSSINPADIEAVARELEANSQSAGMTRLGSRTVSSARGHFSFQALTPTSVPEESTPLGLESQSDPSVPRSSGQALVDGTQPLPSPPQTELDADGVSPVPSPAGMPLH